MALLDRLQKGVVQPPGHRPGFAIAHHPPVHLDDRAYLRGRTRQEGFVREGELLDLNGPFRYGQLEIATEFEDALARDPGEDLVGGMVVTTPSKTVKKLWWAPSRAAPSRTRITSFTPASTAAWAASTFGRRVIALISTRDPRRSGAVIAVQPPSHSSLGGRRKPSRRRRR